MVTSILHFGLLFSVLVSTVKNLPLLASSLKLLPTVLSLVCMLTSPFFCPTISVITFQNGLPLYLFSFHKPFSWLRSGLSQLCVVIWEVKTYHSLCTSLQDKQSPICSDPHLYLLFNANSVVIYRSEFCFVICPVICWTENQNGVWHAGHVQVWWDGQSCACDVVECMTQFSKLWKTDVHLSCYLQVLHYKLSQ